MSKRRPSRMNRKRGDRMGRRAAHKIRATVQYRRDQLRFARRLAERFPSVASTLPYFAKLLRKATAREKRRGR